MLMGVGLARSEGSGGFIMGRAELGRWEEEFVENVMVWIFWCWRVEVVRCGVERDLGFVFWLR